MPNTMLVEMLRYLTRPFDSKSPQRRNRLRRQMPVAVERLEDRMLLSAPDQWLQRGISGGGVLLEPALSPHNPNELFVGTDMSQMFHSKDGGQSWDFYSFNEFVVSNKVTGVQFTSDPQVLFAIDQNNFAFPTPLRSTDAGATWDRPGSAGFASNWKTTEQAWRLFADPNSPGRLVVATQDELYLSTDSGATFTSAYTYTGTVSQSLKLGIHLAGVFFDGADIYAATNAGLLLSTNGGAFQTATIGGNAIGGIPSDEAFFAFAGASNGTTTRFWAISHDPSTIHTPLDHTAANAGGANVFTGFKNIYTLDVGQTTWTATANGLPATTDLNMIAMAANDIDTVYVGGQDTLNNIQSVYIGKYTTASPSWTSIYTTQVTGNNIVASYVGPGGHIGFSPGIEGLTVDPLNSNRLMMSDGWEAHTSTNGGGLWQQIDVPLSQNHAPGASISDTEAYNNVGINNTTVWWVHWESATEIFAAYDDVKWQRSTDGGATWSFDVNGLNQKNENFSLEVDSATGRMYLSQGRSWAPHDFLGQSDSSVTQGGGDIAYSDDGGANWKILYDFGNPVSWTALDPNDAKTMYASVVDPDPSIGGVYVSHNIDAVNSGGSVAFTRLAAQPSSINVGKPHTIEVLDDGTLVLVLTGRKYDHDNNTATAEQHSAGSGVFRLDPGASQWTDVTHANMHYWCKDLIVDPADPTQSTWYVGVNTAIQPTQVVAGQPSNKGGLYMTTNRGQSWTRVFDKDADSFAVNSANPSEGYVTSSSDGLWITSDLRLADGVTINPSPTFTLVSSFPHQRPNRVFFNPYVPGEVWVASNGAGMLVGNASTPDRTFEFSTANFSANENGDPATTTVQRTGDTANVMSVDYRISDGTATNGSDYTSTNLATGITGTLTFLPGQATATISLPIINDTTVEGNQTVLLTLSGPIGGNFLGTNANATLTIVDDDTIPTISINDMSLTEGDSGSQTVTLTVSLSAATTNTVTVSAASANGSATAPADYTSLASTSLTFVPGVTSQTISLGVMGDTLDEIDETFVVSLSAPTNATLADAQGQITIIDDDASNQPPTISNIANATTLEDVSTPPIPFTIGDAETAAGSLTLSVTSSNTSLVPIANVILGGSGANRTVLATPLADQSGLATITITVSDGSLTATDSFDLTVTAVDDAPIWQAAGNPSAGEGLPLAFTISASDVDTAAGQLVYSASGLPVGATFDAASRTFAWTPVDGQGPADYSVTFSVTDGTTSVNQVVSIHVDDTLTKMYRAYNPNADFHFFTLSWLQFANAVAHGWRDETTGQATFALFAAPTANAVPLFRLYNLQQGNHYYTFNATERDYLISLVPAGHPQFGTIGWRDEGMEGYLFATPAAGASPLFRLYNRTTGVHLFTHDAANMNSVLTLFPQSWVRHTDLGYGFVVPVTSSATAQQAASTRGSSLGQSDAAATSLPSVSDRDWPPDPRKPAGQVFLEFAWPPDPRRPGRERLGTHPSNDRSESTSTDSANFEIAPASRPRMLGRGGFDWRSISPTARLADWDRAWELIATDSRDVFGEA